MQVPVQVTVCHKLPKNAREAELDAVIDAVDAGYMTLTEGRERLDWRENQRRRDIVGGLLFIIALLAILFAGSLMFVSSARGAEPFQVATPEAIRAYRSVVPHFEDADVEKLIHSDPELIWYSTREMPPAFQFDQGYHTPDHDFSADNQPHRGGNANMEFPWRRGTPGGTDNCDNIVTFKAFKLPLAANGVRWPVAVYRTNLVNPINGGNDEAGWAWIFPVGTTFYEFIGQEHRGITYCFEVRSRERLAQSWHTNVYRPFAQASELADALDKLGYDTATIRRPQVTTAVVRDRNRNRPEINLQVNEVSLPGLQAQDVAKLLTRKFVTATDTPWIDGQRPVFAPTTQEGFHIVPRNYRGSIVGVDAQSCMRCHSATNVHARTIDMNTGWYGYTAGSDGILSWHPVEPRTISSNGASNQFQLRRSFVSAGIVARYDASIHPREVYSRIKGLK